MLQKKILNLEIELSLKLFYVDFGAEIGLGHLKRSLVYAQNFSKVIYISHSHQKELLPYQLITIKTRKDFFKKVKELNPSEVIVDNYNFSLDDEKAFKKVFQDIKLSVFDDDYREHFCDEIINHNLGVKSQKYKEIQKVKIIPPLIRDEFIIAKKKRYKKDAILISFGATDTLNMSLKILKSLQREKIYLYTTSQNKELKKLQRYVFLHKNIKLFIDKDISLGMAKSYFAFLTPSTIVYEALFMKLPFIAIQVAKNQDNLVQYLKQKRFKVLDTQFRRVLWKKN